MLAAAVIVVAIALGASGTNLIAGALAGPEPVDASPSPLTYFRDPAARGSEPTGNTEAHGDTEAADRWFRSEQTAEDTYPVPVDDIDPGSTRVVHTGTDGWRVWVGRSTNSGYCLLAYTDSDGSGTSSCVAAAGFAEQGGALGTGYNIVTWNGRDLSVLISRR